MGSALEPVAREQLQFLKRLKMSRAHLDTAPTPSPRQSGVRGFDLGNNGLLTPALSSFGEEREKTGAARGCAQMSRIVVTPCGY